MSVFALWFVAQLGCAPHHHDVPTMTGAAVQHVDKKQGYGAPSGAARQFTQAHFSEEVLNSPQPVLVEFWASWCGPCQMMASSIDALAQSHADRLVVGKVDVDANPSLSAQYAVSAIPRIIVFSNGQPHASLEGYQSQQALVNWVDGVIGAPTSKNGYPITSSSGGK